MFSLPFLLIVFSLHSHRKLCGLISRAKDMPVDYTSQILFHLKNTLTLSMYQLTEAVPSVMLSPTVSGAT